MNITDWTVLGGGIVSIGLINWWFFWAQRSEKAATVNAGIQQVDVVVRGGYDPATVRARAGQPLRLVFERRETSGCSEEVVFPDFGIRKFLPAHEKTPIEIPAAQAGVYEFTCGMSMLRGRIVVE